MKLRVLLVPIAAAVLALVPSVSAQMLVTDRPDLNGDGQIDESEVIEQSNARFEAMDTNNDGMLSPEEYRQAALDRHAQLDSDNDGVVSRREMRSSLKAGR